MRIIKLLLWIDAIILALMFCLICYVLYWSISEMTEKPEPNWIEEPSNELMDFISK